MVSKEYWWKHFVLSVFFNFCEYSINICCAFNLVLELCRVEATTLTCICISLYCPLHWWSGWLSVDLPTFYFFFQIFFFLLSTHLLLSLFSAFFSFFSPSFISSPSSHPSPPLPPSLSSLLFIASVICWSINKHFYDVIGREWRWCNVATKHKDQGSGPWKIAEKTRGILYQHEYEPKNKYKLKNNTNTTTNTN